MLTGKLWMGKMYGFRKLTEIDRTFRLLVNSKRFYCVPYEWNVDPNVKPANELLVTADETVFSINNKSRLQRHHTNDNTYNALVISVLTSPLALFIHPSHFSCYPSKLVSPQASNPAHCPFIGLSLPYIDLDAACFFHSGRAFSSSLQLHSRFFKLETTSTTVQPSVKL